MTNTRGASPDGIASLKHSPPWPPPPARAGRVQHAANRPTAATVKLRLKIMGPPFAGFCLIRRSQEAGGSRVSTCAEDLRAGRAQAWRCEAQLIDPAEPGERKNPGGATGRAIEHDDTVSDGY